MLQMRRDGTDLSRCEGRTSTITRPDRTVRTSILFVRSDDGSAINRVNNRLRDTRFLHGLSGEITASSGVGRNARNKHALKIQNRHVENFS